MIYIALQVRSYVVQCLNGLVIDNHIGTMFKEIVLVSTR